MSLKDSWKETGESLGEAFSGLGKTLFRSGKTAVDKATDWAESDEEKKAEDAVSEVKENAEEAAEEVKEAAEETAEEVKDEAEKDSNVFNDGSWRETGKGLGQAFTNLGKSLFQSAKTGVDKATEWADKKDDEKKEENA